jgi:D-threonate/D-erythronate kinase
LLPALPALGRVCVKGVVFNGGRPVHEGQADPRQRIAGSRPAEHLRAAGASDVVELAAADLAAWAAAPRGFAVVDASSDADLEALVALWPRSAVLLSGTSAAIAASAGITAARVVRHINGPALVVCGSANPVARGQLAAAVGSGTTVAKDAASAISALAARRDTILATPMPNGPIDANRADAEAARLAAQVEEVAAKAPRLAAIVVIGGDTAAAVLGTAPVRVLGSVAPGTAWLVSSRYRLPVITRAGGFGDERALADLLWGTLRS